MDADEAISSNWVTATGERVWVVPAKDENHYITFVWGFDDYNKAELFFSLMKEEIGRETEGNDSLPWAMEKGYCAVAYPLTWQEKRGLLLESPFLTKVIILQKRMPFGKKRRKEQ